MLYIERDDQGNIKTIHHAQQENSSEKKSLIDEEVLEFLQKEEPHVWVKLLSLSDISIIRIIEDLIELLIKKNIILFTELPEAAQKKIQERRTVRQKMDTENIMVEDIL